MKKIAALLVAGGMAFTLAGCTDHYQMQTNDGRTIITNGKPEVDEDTGMIGYKDTNGIRQQINRSDVKELSELDQ